MEGTKSVNQYGSYTSLYINFGSMCLSVQCPNMTYMGDVRPREDINKFQYSHWEFVHKLEYQILCETMQYHTIIGATPVVCDICE